MENPSKRDSYYSQEYDDYGHSKQKQNGSTQGTPDERRNGSQRPNKQSQISPGDDFQESENQEAWADSDSRRKGELNHNIFVKLQEIARFNIQVGSFEEGLTNYDRCIEHLLKTLPDGHLSAVFVEFLKDTVRSLNEVALKLLQEGRIKESLLLLERCRKMTHPNSFGPYPALRSLTYNHLGCCYRRIGKIDKALYYLEKAWEFIQGSEKTETAGITHINLCAVLSQSGNHKRALEHAKLAVSDCAYDLIEYTKRHSGPDAAFEINKKATMLAIAYHNLATEEEACTNAEAAIQAYLRAFNLIREHNPPGHELCVKFGKAYEEAKVRLSKPGFRRTMSPKSQMKRPQYSPPRVVVKRPPSYNTAGKAAKAYLVNNKVVVPKRRAGNSQQRPMSGNPMLSPDSFQNQKLFLPGVKGQGRDGRPITAHPQSRTQHYQIRGLEETPKNEYPDSARRREEERGNQSEAESEIERLGLNDDELEKADLKSNRLAFLQSLNQYNNQVNPANGKRPAPQRNNFVDDEPTHPRSKEELLPRHKKEDQHHHHQKEPRRDARAHEAATKIQSVYKGQMVRQELDRMLADMPQPVYLVLITDTLKGNLENGPITKETLYYFLMMYELQSQLIHIYIKNLENRKFHSALVEYQVVNRSSKQAIKEELQEACEKLIQRLEIHQDQIYFRDDPNDEGEEGIQEDLYKIGQEMARREQENVITEITERTDERTDESEGKPYGSRHGDDEVFSDRGHKRDSRKKEDSEGVPEEMVEDFEEKFDHKVGKPKEETRKSKQVFNQPKEEELEEDIPEEKEESPLKKKEEPKESPPKKKEEVKEVPKKKEEKFNPLKKREEPKESPLKTNESLVKEEKVEEKPQEKKIESKTEILLYGGRTKKEVDDAAIRIQKHVRGRMARDKYNLYKEKKFKVVFSRCHRVHDDIVGLRLLERIDDPTNPSYELCCYDFSRSKQFKVIEFPKNYVKLSTLTSEELASKVEFNFLKYTVKVRPGVTERQQTPPPEIKRKQTPPPKEEEDKFEEDFEEFEEEPVEKKKEETKKSPLFVEKKEEEKHSPEQKKKEEEDKEEAELVNNVTNMLGLQLFGGRPKKEVDAAAIKIQSNVRGKQTREKYDILKGKKTKLVFNRLTRVNDHMLGLRLLEKLQHPEDPNYNLVCYDYTVSKQFDTIDFPKKQANLSTLTPEQLAEKLEFNIEKTTVKLRPEETAEQLAAVPLYFGDEKLDSTIHYDKKDSKILVKHGFGANKPAKVLEVDVEDLDMGKRFSREEFVNNMDIVLLSKLNYKNGNLIYEKSPVADSVFRKPVHLPEGKEENEDRAMKKDDSLPDLNDPDVQNATMKIQGAYKKRMTKKVEPKLEEKPQEKKSKSPGPNQRYSQKVDDLEEKPVNHQSGQLFIHREADELRGHPEKKKEDEDEMPNLDDPDVQNATMKIQNAYKKKQDRNKAKEAQKEEKKPEFAFVEVEEKGGDQSVPAHHKKEQKKEEEDEMPDLNDPDVQGATLKIQNAYKKKQNRNQAQLKEREPLEKKQSLKAESKGNVSGRNAGHLESDDEDKKHGKKKDDEDEMPDLNDPEVQGATLKIQNAYKKKQNKNKEKVAVEEKAKEKQPEVEFAWNEAKEEAANESAPVQKNKKKQDDDEMPDLNDPEVQGATLKIQNAYKKKQNKKAAVEEKKPVEEVVHPRKEEPVQAQNKKEDDDELPNLEDPDVQGATLKIQNAYKKKQNRNKEKLAAEEKAKESQPEQIVHHPVKEEKKKAPVHKKEEEGELPDLNDPDVQGATMKIQNAYKKKQKRDEAKQKERELQKKPSEKVESRGNISGRNAGHLESDDEEDNHKPHKKEEEDEMPNLEDPDVQNATMKIQNAYKKKQNRNKAKEAPKEEKKPEFAFVEVEEKGGDQSVPAHHKKEQKKEEEDEMPDLNDPDVQGATLKIQNAYKKKQNKNKQKEEKKQEPIQKKLSEKSESQKRLHGRNAGALENDHDDDAKKVQEKEEDEMPNLEDPAVQDATRKIQNAYKKKQQKVQQPKHVEARFEASFEHRKPQPAEQNETSKIVLNDAQEDFMGISAEYDDDDNKPYEEEHSVRHQTAKHKKEDKKAPSDDEDFELLEEDQD